MRQHLRRTAIAAALASIATAASATPLTIGDSLAPDTYLGSGTTTGSFDGSGLLPPLYDVNSATFSFVFADDTDTRSSTSSSSTSYTPYTNTASYYNGNYVYEYTRTGTTTTQTTVTGQSESVTASIDGQAVGSGATTQSTTVDSSGTYYTGRTTDPGNYYPGYSYYYRCGNYTCGGYQPGTIQSYYTNNYAQTTTTTTDWTGGFTIGGALTDAMLADFAATGLLPFSLNVTGDLRLVSASLSLDITDRTPPIVPLSALPPADVPEPGSLALAAAGLGGIAFARRRRKQG